MKNKIFEQMIENGDYANATWDLGDFYRIFEKVKMFVYNTYDYIIENNYDFNMQDIDKSKFENMIDFIGSFMQALEELEFEEIPNNIVGNKAKISLENTRRMPYSMSSLSEDSISVENKLRECKWYAEDLCDVLNYHSNKEIFGTKAVRIKNWKIKLFRYDKIILEGIDNCGNKMYLIIEREENR